MNSNEKWWSKSIEEITHELKTNIHDGLTSNDAKQRLQISGHNKLPEQKRISSFKIFINQFSSIIIWILIIAALIAGVLGEIVDSLAIAVIVIFNAILGFIQEYRAESSIAALKKLVTPTSKVVRDGKLQTIDSDDLVPGDLVLLESGDRIPADGRIIQTYQISTQEAALTGESSSIYKIKTPLPNKELPIGDRKNMAFMGTVITSGKGYMIVTQTALKTELGKIASMLDVKKEEKTPLQLRLAKLGLKLIYLFLGIVIIVFFLGILRKNPLFDMFLTSLSLAVAAIPEGLPAIVTVALSIGVRKMAKRKALIRRLPSVETLGCTSVICTDKTGTLTQNKMQVKKIWVNEKLLDVTGTGYEPKGDFKYDQKIIDPQESFELLKLLETALLCNNANLNFINNKWEIVGDPTEGALLVAAQKAGLIKTDLEKQYPLLYEIPFDSERKKMSVLRETKEENILFLKGALDNVLKSSSNILLNGEIKPLTDQIRQKILDANNSLTNQGQRVLAIAYRNLKQVKEINISFEEALIFVGLIAMIDPPRAEVKEAIQKCKNAGIRPIMITGDHKGTAIAIAKELNMMNDQSIALNSEELEQMDDNTLINNIDKISVYSRVSAEHKLRIIKAFKAKKQIVAMTGDGVNDAPAIKEADIGISMGITGTDVTKEASDMIILDDNFASIVNAIEEGRGIYDNIIKFVSYLLCSNIAEILVIFTGMALGFKDPEGNPFVSLTAIQLLWINLVTDGFPAIALGMDPIDPRAMNRPPRDPSKPILNLHFNLQLISIAIIITIGTIVACHFGLRTSANLARTMTFSTLIMLEFVRIQMVRSNYNISFFSNPWLLVALASSFFLLLIVVYLPPLQIVFKTVPLGFIEWSLIVGIIFVTWWLAKLINWMFKLKNKKNFG
ncbi:MAG: Calcium-transporting ATPase [Candidatus Anoxychlamydiales bacterium]|nr:Calcium-transporting ATPase [Candidatus Anoxychlamydiales bacterium]